MELWQNELWRRYFGIGWKRLITIDPSIGAFLAVHDTKQVLIDDNARSLLGFKKLPSYEELISAVKHIQEQSSLSIPAQIEILETDSAVYAGFIHITEVETATNKALTRFPLHSPAEMLHQMTQEDGPSLVALIQLENINNPSFMSACISGALDAIYGVLPANTVVAVHALMQFWIYVPGFDQNATGFLNNIRNAVENCSPTDEFGVAVAEGHSITATIGCSLEGAIPSQRLHAASFALYEAISNGAGSIRFFSSEQYELQKNDYQNIKAFSRLIDQNLFLYHFQPIVNAHTGEIIAYEALMRTDESIGLNPFQILTFAQRFNRLYDIEKATLYNTIAYIGNNQEAFADRKLFINSIPAHLLTDEDYQKLRADYGELLEKVVIELTEQTEISDRELDRIHSRLKSDHMQMAIDDYGTGYSNTSNLLRYNPDIVKIDRSLITNIDSDEKMRNIVAGIISFLHGSGYLALAEGVETFEELRCMIELGSDLIQGYYISKPKPILLREIAEDVKTDILNINMDAASGVQRIYRPEAGEMVDISQLALEKYTDLFVDVPNITLVSEKNRSIPLAVTVKDDTACEITLRNVDIISLTDAPVIKLGQNCDVRILCDGANRFEKMGISVPRTSSLRLSGSGTLDINAEYVDCYAIGSSSEHSYGTITIDMTGKLTITANGEKCVAIGGGKNKDRNPIHVWAGELSITCSGGTCVGIGSHSGPAWLDFSNCDIQTHLSSASAVSIGAVTGEADISLYNFNLSCTSAGSAQAAVGVLREGTGSIRMVSGQLKSSLKGVTLSCVGTRSGNMDCTICHSAVNLYCEGSSVSGIGDISGSGDVSVSDTDIIITFLTGDGMDMGSRDGKLEKVNCKEHIKINE